MFNEIRVVLRRTKLGKVLQHSILRTLIPPKSNIDTKNHGLEHVSPFKPWLAFGIHVRPVGPWMKTLSLHLNKFPSNRISQPIRDCHIPPPPTTSKLIVIQDPKCVKISSQNRECLFLLENRQQKSVRRCTAMPIDLIAYCIVSYHFILLCCRIQIEAGCV